MGRNVGTIVRHWPHGKLMHLAIISPDPIQAHVLAGVARRRAWVVTQFSSVDSCVRSGLSADAFILDVERVDTAAWRESAQFATRVGRSRVFLLSEAVDSGPSTGHEPPAAHVSKPFHPPELIRLIEASVARRISAG